MLMLSVLTLNDVFCYSLDTLHLNMRSIHYDKLTNTTPHAI